MVANVTKIFQKMKNKSLLSEEKKLWNLKKCFTKIIRKHFLLLYKVKYKRLFYLHLHLKSSLTRIKKCEIFDFQALQILS